MKILFLTINRSARVATHFAMLQKKLSEMVDVEFLVRNTRGELAGKYCRKILEGKFPPETFFAGSQFDLVVTDAPFAFVNEDWQKTKQPRVVILEDMHGWMCRETINLIKKYGAELVLHRYNSLFESYPDLGVLYAKV